MSLEFGNCEIAFTLRLCRLKNLYLSGTTKNDLVNFEIAIACIAILTNISFSRGFEMK